MLVQFVGVGKAGHAFLQFMDACPLLCADIDAVLVGLRDGFQQVGFVVGNEVVDFLLAEKLDHFLFVILQAYGGIHHQHSYIGFIQHLTGLFDTQQAQFPHVVVAGGVDDHHRAHGQQFHGLVYRVGSGALGIRNDGKLLAGHGIYNTGFTGIAAAEKADMDAVGGRGIVQAHGKAPFLRWRTQNTPPAAAEEGAKMLSIWLSVSSMPNTVR